MDEMGVDSNKEEEDGRGARPFRTFRSECPASFKHEKGVRSKHETVLVVLRKLLERTKRIEPN